jgi:hypothetical protein
MLEIVEKTQLSAVQQMEQLKNEASSASPVG